MRCEPGGPVAPQRREALDAARAEQPLGEGRHEDDVRSVVAEDGVEIAGVPGRDPLPGEGIGIDHGKPSRLKTRAGATLCQYC